MTIQYFLEKAEAPGVELVFERKSKGASGYDVMANIGVDRTIYAGKRFTFRTGLYLAMTVGIEAQVRGRSGLTRDWGVSPMLGTVDSDYRGEVRITLFNHGDQDYVIHPGDRIAQLVFARVLLSFEDYPTDYESQYHRTKFPCVVRVDDLSKLGSTDRGAGGYGSTGR